MNQLEELYTSDNAPEVIRKSNKILQGLETSSRVSESNNATQFRGTINEALQSAPNLQQYAIDEDHNAKIVVNHLNWIKEAIENGQDPENPDTPTLPDKLNVLVLGNSHSEDAWSYVPFILSKLGIDYLIVLALHRGEYLYNYVNNWTNGDSAGRVDDVYYIDSSQVNSGWKTLYKDNQNNKNWHPARVLDLTYGDLGLNSSQSKIAWNIVSVQPYYDGSNTSTTETSGVESNIINVSQIIRSNSNCLFGVTIESVGAQYKPSLQQAKNILKSQTAREKVDIFFPVGPAVYKMRVQKKYRNLKTNYILRNLAGDWNHLSEGIGNYLGACAVIQSILEYYNSTKSLNDPSNDFMPSKTFINNNIPWPNGMPIIAGTSDSEEWQDCKEEAHSLAQSAVTEITNILNSSNITNAVDNWNIPSNGQTTITVKAVGCDLSIKYDKIEYQCLNGSAVVLNVPMYTQALIELKYTNCTKAAESSRLVFGTEYGDYYYPNPNWGSTDSSIQISTPAGTWFSRSFSNVCNDYEYSIINIDSPTPPEVIDPESVQLNLDNITLTQGESRTLTATVLPSNTTDKTVTWGSSNLAIATVNNGTVTAIAVGECDITATCQTVSATCHVTVQQQETPDQPDNNTFTVNGVSFTMIPVEGGTFTMGSPTTELGRSTNEDPQHEVTLSSFKIGQTQVTQELWQAVMNSNPSHFKGNLQRPVEQVSWEDCQTFITTLNGITEKNFRLPTEAEWEFAARGGIMSEGHVLPGVDPPLQGGDPTQYIWYTNNANGTTQPVGTKKPNELGLYDMGGNVFEWCKDWYLKDYYSTSPSNDPPGPETGTWRVYRGGGYNRPVKECRCAFRYMGYPDVKYDYLGLRLALDN